MAETCEERLRARPHAVGFVRSGEGSGIRWATFDCYGTLIDWDAGIGRTLAGLWPHEDAEALLALYHEAEREVEAGVSLPYREVMRRGLVRVASSRGLDLASADEDALAESLPSWPAFPEVRDALSRLRDDGWRVGILSNVDPDLLRSSVQHLGIAPDVTITVAEAGSYKPSPGHWRAFFDAVEAPRERHVHVAQSTYHDIAPCAELGLRAVWINRLGQSSDLPRAAELRDLRELADTLLRLV